MFQEIYCLDRPDIGTQVHKSVKTTSLAESSLLFAQVMFSAAIPSIATKTTTRYFAGHTVSYTFCFTIDSIKVVISVAKGLNHHKLGYMAERLQIKQKQHNSDDAPQCTKKLNKKSIDRSQFLFILYRVSA